MALSEAARKNNVYVIGGTIPERSHDKLYNTCTVWGPDGKLVTKHRKVKINAAHAFIQLCKKNILLYIACVRV